jgi:hypothetical protein
MTLNEALNTIEERLTGRLVSQGELKTLTDFLGIDLIPQWYLDLLAKFRLIGTEFSLDEDQDLSELGVELRWMSPEETISEARDTFPGILAVQKGYLPVGICLEGSGDPYFLQISQNTDPEVVRIPHTSCSEDEFDEEKVEMICSRLSDFFIRANINQKDQPADR